MKKNINNAYNANKQNHATQIHKNENNAKYLLAGYNTMSKEEKESFDLINYLKFFRKFFINLTIYSTLFFVIFYIAFDEITALIAYCVPIVAATPYMIYKGNKFKTKK